MNKKCYAYNLLILLFLHQSSFTMQNALSQTIALSSFIGAVSYGIAKGAAIWKIRTEEDAPQNVQIWARDILAKKNIINAHSVPLKLGEGWCVYGGAFIQIDKNIAQVLEKNLTEKLITSQTKKQMTLAERSLLHEAQHYHNGDIGKGFLIFSLSIIPLVFSNVALLKKTSSYLLNIPKFLIGLVLPIVSYIPCKRHQEIEADRFAFMNLSSIKKLKINRDHKLYNAEQFEFNLINYPYSSRYSLFENTIYQLISDKIKCLDQNLLNCFDSSSKYIIKQKNTLIAIANFIHDHQRPSYRHRVTIADECLKKRNIIENHL